MKKRLLCISTTAPFPILDGAGLRLHNLLVNLMKYWTIDIVCPRPAGSFYERELETNYSKIF